MEKFVCSHCGHHFTAKPAEGLICPNCSWSTSVTKETGPPKETAQKPAGLTGEPASPADPKVWWWGGGAVVVFSFLFIGIALFVARHLGREKEILQKIESKNAEVISTQAPELALSPEEREILFRRVTLKPSEALSDSEKSVLETRFPFRPARVRGLPSPPWSEKEFDEFLRGQESQYRIPLERSYRRKLKAVFKDRYLPAAQAFEAKDSLKARDEWIRSLAFPVYQNDPQRHRGVVLTMLRPFINDTLSKIGALNALFTEKDLYATEEKVQSSYESFYLLLQKHSWEEAYAQLLELQKEIEGLGKLPKQVSPPPLPQEISWLDPDLREVILAQTAPMNSSLPDLNALGQDLASKEKVIQSRLPASVETALEKYARAVSLLEGHRWEEAQAALQEIDFPEALAEDARAKSEILRRWLDSQEKTG